MLLTVDLQIPSSLAISRDDRPSLVASSTRPPVAVLGGRGRAAEFGAVITPASMTRERSTSTQTCIQAALRRSRWSFPFWADVRAITWSAQDSGISGQPSSFAAASWASSRSRPPLYSRIAARLVGLGVVAVG